jgi:plasmid stability protein
MPSLLVRNVDAALIEQLRRRARSHGRSLEAEHRAILREALSPRRTGRDLLALIRSGPGLDLDPDTVRSDETGRAAELADG